jgi:hypothetical protein
LAARGNRLVRVGRLGVAFIAAAAVALGQTLPALAGEAAPSSPAETTSAETTAAETTAAPDTPSTTTTAEQTGTESTPANPSSTPPAKEPEATPAADTKPETAESAPETTPASETPTSDAAPSGSAPAETAPAASEPTAVPKDPVKLEPAAPAPAPQAAPTPQPAAPAPAPAPTATPTPTPTITLQVEPAAAPEPSAAASAEAATAATALIVSFRPRAGISLLPAEEPAVKTVRSVRKARPLGKQLVRGTCARPAARVPLSLLCEQARAFAVLRATFTSSPSPEVRAEIERVAPVTIRRDDARPPPESKTAKKHTVAKVRPTVPFGSSGQGVANDGFSGSPGSSSSSRLFALAAVPMRVPLPFRFARVRVPSTRPHGVIAAPPTARPG